PLRFPDMQGFPDLLHKTHKRVAQRGVSKILTMKTDEQIKRPYTSKQMGDACEMLVAAEMTLAGVPAMKMADNWPCYDVIAQPQHGGPPQRISVKSRTFKRGGDTFVVYDYRHPFDWLAIVLLPGADQTTRR